MMQWLPWLTLGLALVALLLALLAWLAGGRRWRRELQGRDELIADKEARLARLEQEFAELRQIYSRLDEQAYLTYNLVIVPLVGIAFQPRRRVVSEYVLWQKVG